VEPEQTRKLVLLRHAKSAWPDDVPDHDRPLGLRGRRDAPAAGRWLRRAGLTPDHVVCSTARRARETWQLAGGELAPRPPEATFEPRVYGASADTLLGLVRLLPDSARTVVVVGHDPGLPELALALAGGAGPDNGGPIDYMTAAPLARIRAKFPTAAIAVLEVGAPWSAVTPGRARLASFVTPRDQASGGIGAAQ
jgi:phosphohistidine phosphatase